MAKRRRHKRRSSLARTMFSLLGILVLLGGLAAAAGWYAYQEFAEAGPLNAAKTVLVERGASSTSIARKLEEEGIISSATLFLAALMAQRQWEGGLKAGEYEFAARTPMREVLDKMRRGETATYKVTIPEGFTTQQILRRIEAHDALSGKVPEDVAEGVLLPDTYLFTRGTQRREIVERMRKAQQRLLDELWDKRDPDIPIETPEEAVILASIVEKETGEADERQRVAAVFHNRLRKRMRLQSDPTIVYGLVGGEGGLGRPIRQSEIDGETPYNTYRIDGLPPTPIANPGRKAIAAVLNPSETDELYFVADGTGGHAFALTLDEHRVNVRRWRKIEAERRAAAAEREDEDPAQVLEERADSQSEEPGPGVGLSSDDATAASEPQTTETAALDGDATPETGAGDPPAPDGVDDDNGSGAIEADSGPASDDAEAEETAGAPGTIRPMPRPAELERGTVMRIDDRLVPIPRARPGVLTN